MSIPDSMPAVPEPLPSDEQRKITEDKWDNDEYALKIVRSDWAFAETYRINAHDWRYRNAAELFLGWAGQQYWEGTRVPRSSLGVFVIFEQVQAALSKIVPQVGNPDSFQYKADLPETDPDLELIGQAQRKLITGQLKETHFRRQVRQALQSLLQLGNGILEVGYEDYEEEYVNFDQVTTPRSTAMLQHPLAGPIPITTGVDQRFTRKIQKERKQRPYIRYVSLMDIYVDPNCESPSMQEAGYIIKRVYMRAEQIKALAKSKDFRIPDDEYLTRLSLAKSTSNQDVTKLSNELFRYNMWNPSQDYTSDPSQKRIAVVEYTTAKRKVWWLQGQQDAESIIYNEPNRYGCINYFNASYADVLDRWHALAVSDVAEGEQRLQQAIINSRVDELALALHPPIYKRRGVTIPWYQLKRAPGRVVETETPADDIKEAEIHNITEQAFVEVAASENRVQRITGLTDLAALGTPSSGGNSANRTATGVNTQAGATQDRMRFVVENVEEDLIEKAVNFMVQCNRKFIDLKTVSNWLKMDPSFQKLDPLKVMKTKLNVECRASTKMAARMAFLQSFPQIAQVFFNPELLQLLGQQQKQTLNVKTVVTALQDAMNYAFDAPLFMPMTPDQIKAQQQPPPEEMMKMQMAQQQMQSDQQINDNNLKTKFSIESLKAMLKAHTDNAQMDDEHLQSLLKILADVSTAEEQAKRPVAGAGAGKSSKSSK